MQYLAQQITEFVDTNLTDIYPEWSGATTYSLELDDNALTSASMARYGTYYYRSLINSNLNFNPNTYEDKKWVKYLISNKFAMLDLSAQSKSVIDSGDLYVVFEQGLIDTIGIGNYEAEEVKVEILDSDMLTVLWSDTTSSTRSIGVTSWYTYLNAPLISTVDRTIKITLPQKGSYVKVTLKQSPDTNRAACGYLVGGNSISMGTSLMGVSFSYTSYAVKEINAFGSLKITKRAVQDLVDFETVIPSGDLADFRREVKKVYNDIVLFVIDENDDSRYENIMTLGVIQDAGIVLENEVESIMTFSIMEAV